MPMVLERDGALRFGGVRRQDQVEAHPPEGSGDLAGVDVGVQNLSQAVPPKRLHRRQPLPGLRRSLPLHGRILLDEAQQVKRDRVRLGEALQRHLIGRRIS